MRTRRRKLRKKPQPPALPHQRKRRDGPRPKPERERATYTLFRSARTKARQAGEDFTLTEADIDIPDVCPASGISLYRGSGRGHNGPHSPALATIDPAKGWTPGNVVVVSLLAKRAMSDATPEALFRVADWWAAQRGPSLPAASPIPPDKGAQQ